MTHELIKNRRQLLFTQARQVGYLVVLCLTVLLQWKLADIYKSDLIIEHGVIENTQSGILLLAALSLCVQACLNRSYRSLMLLLASLTLAACIREQDAWLDECIPYVGWQFAWVFPITAVWYAMRDWRGCLRQLTEFLRSNSFGMMMTALTIIIPVAQLLGHRSYLNDLINDPDINASIVRRALEEPIEMIGYVQILLATAEFHIEQWLDRH